MLETAIEAAYEAGKLLKQNFGGAQNVNEATQRDIKLEIDEQTQKCITRVILADFPDHAILGEEGVTGRQDADVRWVVDPLDATVNYFYGIPHYCTSIAAQQRTGPDTWQTVAGVVYAPEVDELFAASTDQPATLNNQPIHVSQRARLDESIIGIGFFKSEETMRLSMTDFQRLLPKVRKMRLMGSAALDVVYVACGRFDAYIEYGIKLWDICAGQLILERAGGRAIVTPTGEPHTLNLRMWNGVLDIS
jgi:myo-inositol-1(or 4)-monophosphatase